MFTDRKCSFNLSPPQTLQASCLSLSYLCSPLHQGFSWGIHKHHLLSSPHAELWELRSPPALATVLSSWVTPPNVAHLNQGHV